MPEQVAFVGDNDVLVSVQQTANDTVAASSRAEE